MNNSDDHHRLFSELMATAVLCFNVQVMLQ